MIEKKDSYIPLTGTKSSPIDWFSTLIPNYFFSRDIDLDICFTKEFDTYKVWFLRKEETSIRDSILNKNLEKPATNIDDNYFSMTRDSVSSLSSLVDTMLTHVNGNHTKYYDIAYKKDSISGAPYMPHSFHR